MRLLNFLLRRNGNAVTTPLMAGKMKKMSIPVFGLYISFISCGNSEEYQEVRLGSLITLMSNTIAGKNVPIEPMRNERKKDLLLVPAAAMYLYSLIIIPPKSTTYKNILISNPADSLVFRTNEKYLKDSKYQKGTAHDDEIENDSTERVLPTHSHYDNLCDYQ